MNTTQALLGAAFAFYAVGIGVLIYFLFGRGRKTFSRRSRLLKHDLRESAMPLLSPLLERQDAEIRRLERRSEAWRRLMTLVRRNSTSALSVRNEVEIQQDASVFYPSLARDLQAARSSIHLQYFIWAVDPFTDTLTELLVTKAREGVDVRLLYDPIGSQASVGPRYLRSMRAAGVRMAPTSPLSQVHTLAYRNHRKITVVDGSIGYTGGMN
ncbi:MAG TPA: phospholipase D-like domain-containing protein, partial [Zeimonas sp.]